MLKDAWTLAIESLSWLELQRLSERLALAKAAKQLEVKDMKILMLSHKLVFETLRRLNIIDFVLNAVLQPRALDDFDMGVKSFLRLYTYQVLFEKVSYEKAVTIAHMGRVVLGWRQMRDVEETLGRILSFQLRDVIKGAADEEKVALQTFNPTWFVKYSFKMIGRSEAIDFLRSASEPLPTYLRMNTLKASEETWIRCLNQEGVTVEKEPHLKDTYRLGSRQKPLTRTKAFRDGFFYVQDKASCLAVEVANPKLGDTVVDACAAPGAKTSHIAQLMKNQGTIYSIDYSKRRMSVWKREMKRMGVENAVPILVDAQKPLPIQAMADLVILDPPCTSTGTFSKTPSAKWRLTKSSVSNMAKVQWNMLCNCAEKVKAGGHLVYSTCSVSLEENEMLVERFLKWHPDFKLVQTLPRIGLPGLRGQSQCQRLYPHIHECNGFYVAKLERQNS